MSAGGGAPAESSISMFWLVFVFGVCCLCAMSAGGCALAENSISMSWLVFVFGVCCLRAMSAGGCALAENSFSWVLRDQVRGSMSLSSSNTVKSLVLQVRKVAMLFCRQVAATSVSAILFLPS